MKKIENSQQQKLLKSCQKKFNQQKRMKPGGFRPEISSKHSLYPPGGTGVHYPYIPYTARV